MSCNETLTIRQIEVLALVAEGKQNREIAKILNLSTSTVKNHVARIADILHAHNRTHAVAIAVSQGWLPRKGTS